MRVPGIAALLLGLLTFASVTRAQDTNGVPPLWFHVDEEITYDITWGFLHVGETIATASWTNYEGRSVLAFRHRTKTYGIVDSIYPVNDHLETLVDPVTFLPIRFVKNMSEGRHKKHEITIFDHANKKAYWESLTKGKKKEFPIESDPRDIASLMTWLRRYPFVAASKTAYRVMADDKVYDLFLKTAEKPELMELERYGKVEVLRIDPEAAFEGMFVRKGKLTVWVSTDPRVVCTMIKASVPVANIRITLRDIKGPGDDFWVKGIRKEFRAEEAD